CGDDDEIRRRLTAALAQANPRVPTPPRADDPGSPILEKLHLKKWLKFEADATMYNVYLNDDGIEYYTTGSPVSGVWRAEKARHTKFDRAAQAELLDTILGDIKLDRLAREDDKRPKGLMVRPASD
ncbi:MAG: hypothetical protein ACREJM_03650, partial [Candidatus Saccharimonadales bacterium]